MARNKGGFVFTSNFEVKLKEALDPRMTVSAKADLINKESWPYDGDTVYLYEGLIVSAGIDGVYRLIDVAKALEADFSGWERIDAPAAEKTLIVDSLDVERADAALSARQGKLLKNDILTLASKLTGVYTYRGSKNTFDSLPTTDLIPGDVWNVEEQVGNYPAGTNWAWTGTEWDALAGSIDLSSYYTINQVNELVLQEKIRAEAKESELSALIENNSSRISEVSLEVNKNVELINSLSVQIGNLNQKNIEQDNKIILLEETVFGKEGSLSLLQEIKNNRESIVLLNEKIDENVEVLDKKIAVLNGDKGTVGSVDNKIDTALGWIDIEEKN